MSLALTPPAGDRLAAVSPLLSVRGLFKSYPLGKDRIEVLRGLDLQLGPGELVAIMGPSGVGKSTLLNCIAGLIEATEGHIDVGERKLSELNEQGRTLARRDIGIIYQFFNLVPTLDVRENVALPFVIANEAPDNAAIDAALTRVGMDHRSTHLPAQLSGGEMQLVSIARALVRKPKLVLADEPTGNVNVATGRRIMAQLREVLRAEQSALLLVTHNPEDAARADRVEFLVEGQLPPEHRLEGDDVNREKIHQHLAALGI